MFPMDPFTSWMLIILMVTLVLIVTGAFAGFFDEPIVEDAPPRPVRHEADRDEPYDWARSGL